VVAGYATVGSQNSCGNASQRFNGLGVNFEITPSMQSQNSRQLPIPIFARAKPAIFSSTEIFFNFNENLQATPLSRLVAETGGFASLSRDKFAKSHVVFVANAHEPITGRE
jgi:hypothetical protein